MHIYLYSNNQISRKAYLKTYTGSSYLLLYNHFILNINPNHISFQAYGKFKSLGSSTQILLLFSRHIVSHIAKRSCNF